MGGFVFLSDARRHAVEFAARAFDPALRLFLLWARHLRQGLGETPAGAMQDGCRHFQIVIEGNCGGRNM